MLISASAQVRFWWNWKKRHTEWHHGCFRRNLCVYGLPTVWGTTTDHWKTSQTCKSLLWFKRASKVFSIDLLLVVHHCVTGPLHTSDTLISWLIGAALSHHKKSLQISTIDRMAHWFPNTLFLENNGSMLSQMVRPDMQVFLMSFSILSGTSFTQRYWISDKRIVWVPCAVKPIRLCLFLHWGEMLQTLLKNCCSSCQQNINKAVFWKCLIYSLWLYISSVYKSTYVLLSIKCTKVPARVHKTTRVC